MDINNHPKLRPMKMSELLPQLGIDVDQMQVTLTATKKPRPTMASTSTAGKILKPMTNAEMNAMFNALQNKSPKHKAQTVASAKKRWNSSCKLERKTVSHTANGQLKYHSVRKVLNFQPVPKANQPLTNSRITMMKLAASQLQKPEMKANKSLHTQAYTTARISGIHRIPETPVTQNEPIKIRKTMINKENVPNNIQMNKKHIATPQSCLRKRLLASRVPDTPISNDDEIRKSSSDDSFLQNEKKIEDDIIQDLEEQTVENIAEISPPACISFREFSHVIDSSDSSSHALDNTCHDDTIMCFQKPGKENNKAEDSILSLCDMLNKATVSNTEVLSSKLEDLLEERKRIENNIQVLTVFKETQIKSLEFVEKLILEEKSRQIPKIEKDETETQSAKEVKESTNVKNIIIGKPGSVIKTVIRSPLYKIPKNNAYTRKKQNLSPQKEMGEKALSVYLKLKECTNYLSTPSAKNNKVKEVPDTPAMTSHNLQKQLNKLYAD